MKGKRRGRVGSVRNEDTNSPSDKESFKTKGKGSRMNKVNDNNKNIQHFKTPDISLVHTLPRPGSSSSKLSTSALNMTSGKNNMHNNRMGNTLKIPRPAFGKTNGSSIIEDITSLDTREAERIDRMAHTTNTLPLSHFLELEGILDDSEMDRNESSPDCLEELLDSFESRTDTKTPSLNNLNSNNSNTGVGVSGFGKAARRGSLEKTGRLRARQCKIGNWASTDSSRREKYFSLPRAHANGTKLQIENHSGSATSRMLVEDVKKESEKKDEDKNVTFTKGGFIESLD